MNTWRNASLAVTAVAVLALTTACGQDKGASSSYGQSVGDAQPAGQAADQPGNDGYGTGGYGSDAGAASKEAAGQLAVLDSKKLGKVVTDSAGMTLYRFDKDTAVPPKSNCDGDCAKAWPPVPADSVTSAPGTDAALIGQVTRSDGTKQLTIAGWPMYRYAKDTKAGDTNGQGVGGTWHASAPDGKKAAPAAASGAAAAGPADSLPGLSVRKDPKLGNIIVDKRGMTVYRLTKDTDWPMKSACTGACLTKWPVVAPLSINDTAGIIKKGFGTFNRPDGLKQQSIHCWPVYTFSGDIKPGDTNGQGVGGTWYAVTPDAKLVGAGK